MDSNHLGRLEPVLELFRYWVGLTGRHSNVVPDPISDLAHLAPQLMLIDVLPAGFTYRFIGASIVAGLHSDQTGMQVGSSTLVEQVKLEWLETLRCVARHHKPQWIQIDTDVATANVLVLPFYSAGEASECVMAGVFSDASSARPMIRRWRRRDISGLSA